MWCHLAPVASKRAIGRWSRTLPEGAPRSPPSGAPTPRPVGSAQVRTRPYRPVLRYRLRAVQPVRVAEDAPLTGRPGRQAQPIAGVEQPREVIADLRAVPGPTACGARSRDDISGPAQRIVRPMPRIAIAVLGDQLEIGRAHV